MGLFSEQSMFEVCNRNPLQGEEEDVNVGNSLTDLYSSSAWEDPVLAFFITNGGVHQSGLKCL